MGKLFYLVLFVLVVCVSCKKATETEERGSVKNIQNISDSPDSKILLKQRQSVDVDADNRNIGNTTLPSPATIPPDNDED